jgi:hypothetical protein
MTPRPGVDYEGLSAAPAPEFLPRKPGERIGVQVIQTRLLHILTVVRDSPTHVTITPGTSWFVAEWAATRDQEGVVSPWTIELQAAVVDSFKYSG